MAKEQFHRTKPHLNIGTLKDRLQGKDAHITDAPEWPEDDEGIEDAGNAGGNDVAMETLALQNEGTEAPNDPDRPVITGRVYNEDNAAASAGDSLAGPDAGTEAEAADGLGRVKAQFHWDRGGVEGDQEGEPTTLIQTAGRKDFAQASDAGQTESLDPAASDVDDVDLDF
jgi:hypothetical protein